MLTTSEAIEKIKGPALSELQLIHQQLLANNGTTVDRFYAGRLGLGDPFADCERELLHAIEKAPPAQAYHEIGGGIGLVPITLGLMGRKAVNIDSAPSRVAHGSQILRSLAVDDPTLAERVQMVCASVPEVFDDLDTTGAYAVCTNVGVGRSSEFVDAFLRAVQDRYTAFIFDLCLLWGVYRKPEEWQARLDLLATAWGGQRPELLFEIPGPARYYIMRFKQMN